VSELRVGVDLIHLEEHAGGTATYARELLGALLAAEPGLRLTVFAGVELPRWFDAQPWRGEVELVRYPVTVTHGPPHNLLRLMATRWIRIAGYAARRRLHVVHGPANIVPLYAPRVATVVTVLDLIWMRFATTMSRRATLAMKLHALPSIRAADRVIAISEWVKQDLIRTLRIPAGRIDAIPLGVRRPPGIEPTPEPELRRRLGLGDGPVILTLGQKREHKNQIALIRALPESAVLVIPGAPTPYESTLRAAADGRMVVFPDWLSDADVEGLYGLATCFALPSLEEGFGLPVLEAMQRGVPVACSDTTSLPEVAGDAALLFDPRDDASVAAALQRLIADADLRERLRRAGRERAAAFTWERCARATLDVYRRAAAG
jgi:glycosyltransferase involved in cell wall biosynthesis